MRKPLVLLLGLAAAALAAGWLLLDCEGSASAGGGSEAGSRASSAVPPRQGEAADPLSGAPDALSRAEAATPAVEAPFAASTSLMAIVRVVRGDGAPLGEQAVVLLAEESNGGRLPAGEAEAYRLANQDEQLDRWGRAHPCDGAGLATIAVPDGEWFPVGARSGPLWGRTDVMLKAWSPGKELVVVLHPALHVPVLALDEAGAPVADAPVCHRIRRRGGDDVDSARTLTDADGRAELRHLQEALAQRGSSATRHSAALALPFESEVRADFDPLAPPADPLLLILPAHGAVEVELQDAAGGPESRSLSVALQRHAPDLVPPPHEAGMSAWSILGVQHRRTAGSVARFERVGLGLELEYGTDFGGGFVQSAVGRGPQRAGETVRLVLRRSDEFAALTGRILDGADEPLAGASLIGSLYPPDSDRRIGVVRLNTDAGGRFRAPIEDANLPAGEIVLLATESERGRALFLAARFALPIPAQGLELGDLFFGHPLAVRGIALGPDSAPRGDAFGMIGPVRGDNPFGRRSASPFANLQWQADEAGRFELLGPLPPGPWRLLANLNLDPALACPPVEFSPGAGELVLRFVKPPGLFGRVLADPGIPLEEISIEWTVPGSWSNSGGFRADTGEFWFQPKRREAVDLVLRGGGWQGAELWRRSGILADPETVSELGEVDLRGKLQVSRIVLRDAHGAALSRAMLWHEPEERSTLRFPLPAEFPLQVVHSRPRRCWIEAPGHAVAELLVERPEHELRLEPGWPVRIECSGVPEDGRWRLRLMRDPDAGPPPLPCQVTSDPALGSAAIQFVLPAAGRWTALLEIADPDGRTFRTKAAALGEPAPVLKVQARAGEQAFRLAAAEGAFR